MTTLQVRQDAPQGGRYPIRLSLQRHAQPALEAEAHIERVESKPNISFVPVPPAQDGRIRLLYIACRPSGSQDVELRVIANRLLQDLGPDRARFDIKALRPPTFERLQKELADAKAAGQPYHIVYAGQGKSSTAVEFARWYTVTGGLGAQPLVLLASFENHTDLADLLNQIGQPLAPFLSNPAVDWTAQNDLAGRLKIVKRILRTFPILWIWDNVEPVAGFPEGTESQWTDVEQSELRDFLKQIKLGNASKVKILLTSRRDEAKWLGGIPHRIPMRRMRNSDAARLALKLGEERNLKRSEIADWQPLLDYCAGNPLTLRVLQQRAFLLRARAYAEAALRDFKHYQGRAAKDEADAQSLLDSINQDLAELPQ
ncbi:MAG: hypothetical protein ACJ74J_07985 [Blastocatellia bacterium]